MSTRQKSWACGITSAVLFAAVAVGVILLEIDSPLVARWTPNQVGAVVVVAAIIAVVMLFAAMGLSTTAMIERFHAERDAQQERWRQADRLIATAPRVLANAPPEERDALMEQMRATLDELEGDASLNRGRRR